MMYGDFSRWSFDPQTNYSGILHQQGRVLLDADTNDQTLLQLRWQEVAARDAFGECVLAVPVGERDAFKVSAVSLEGDDLRVSLLPGRAWADGRLVHLRGDPSDLGGALSRLATGLQPPNSGDDQVVLLEVWRDAISAFQAPRELIEPALGGPDTTERVATCFRLLAVPAAAGESCEEVARRVQDDLRAPTRGRLTVTLAPTSVAGGDCPVFDHGGYAGLEHNLFLIEIAEVDPTPSPTGAGPYFKWSPVGGGLVGRGQINASGHFELRGGREAILRAGLHEVYVEILEPRPLRSPPVAGDRDAALAEHWQVVYGAKATLSTEGSLIFSQDYFGTPPVAFAPRACRIWHGLRDISEFPVGLINASELRDGIRLQFDPSLTYVAGDRWSFSVRAGGLANPPVLLDDAPPTEIARVRVPLARIRWQGQVAQIDDCRRVFQPLTRQQTCCQLRVGDGVHSHGDFTSIQEALAHLPHEGGEICVLPGLYRESVLIDECRNLTIRGCGEQTRIAGEADAPIFTVRDCKAVTIRDLNMRSGGEQRGIHLDRGMNCRILNNRIAAQGAPAIEAEAVRDLEIADNRIRIRDVPSSASAVVVQAIGARITGNTIRVPVKHQSEELPSPSLLARPTLQTAALGGLWLRGGCERVEVLDNRISGGRSHGIVLGHLEQITIEGQLVGSYRPVEESRESDALCPPGVLWIPPPNPDQDSYTVAGPPLRRIRISGNTITDMGFSGISVVGFLPTIRQGLIAVEGLEIAGNTIERCLHRPLANTRKEMLMRMGYGGIILADAEDLRICDNRILDNGVRHIEAICGIYILHVEGAEISGNLIANNGPRTADSGALQPGARGGIVVRLATSPVVDIDVTPGTAPSTWVGVNLERRGLPAIRVCDNTVVAPVGRALTISCLGPALVTDNNLTTLGVAPGTGLVFAAVQILALGLSPEMLSAKASFVDLRTGSLASRSAAPQKPLVLLDHRPPAEEATLEARPPSVSLALAKPSPLLLLIPTGDVLFANNQVLLDLRDGAKEFALSAIGIFSLDDVAFQGNQSNCALYGDVIWVHAMVVAMSVRVCQNRLKEPLPSAYLSAVTFGLANTTTHNQSTHCLLIRGAAKIDSGNIEAIEAFSPGSCKRLSPILSHR